MSDYELGMQIGEIFAYLLLFFVPAGIWYVVRNIRHRAKQRRLWSNGIWTDAEMKELLWASKRLHKYAKAHPPIYAKRDQDSTSS